HAVASHRPWKPDPFDQACLWLAKHTTTTATVLTHHPAELYWQSGRQAWTPEDVDLDDPAGLARRRIFFIVVEPGPPDDPLRRFVESYPNRVRLKMSAGARPDVRVYAVAW
ncbi:MAG TPA: hypothetical protein VFT74_10300, partial [Isosphaeraceae bacterium]|nr:hypothetical protein [Isosphaeraceae bacterium]